MVWSWTHARELGRTVHHLAGGRDGRTETVFLFEMFKNFTI